MKGKGEKGEKDHPPGVGVCIGWRVVLWINSKFKASFPLPFPPISTTKHTQHTCHFPPSLSPPLPLLYVYVPKHNNNINSLVLPQQQEVIRRRQTLPAWRVHWWRPMSAGGAHLLSTALWGAPTTGGCGPRWVMTHSLVTRQIGCLAGKVSLMCVCVWVGVGVVGCVHTSCEVP